MNAPSVTESVSSSPHIAPRRKSRLLAWVALAFVVQLAAWAAWFTIAAQHRVAEVPLAITKSAR